MIPTYVVCPVRNHLEDLTRPFMEMMSEQAGVTDLCMIDNGSTDGTLRWLRERKQYRWSELHVYYKPGRTIYEMWSFGFARARRLASGEPFNFLLLNNDVTLANDSVRQMDHWLRSDFSFWAVYPDYDAAWCPTDRGQSLRETYGVFGGGGLFGPAFMLAGERIYWTPLITDPELVHWYGDDHLAECIELAGGRQGRIVGLPILHVNEGTARDYDLWNQKLHDRGRWITRHQRGFGVAP